MSVTRSNQTKRTAIAESIYRNLLDHRSWTGLGVFSATILGVFFVRDSATPAVHVGHCALVKAAMKAMGPGKWVGEAALLMLVLVVALSRAPKARWRMFGAIFERIFRVLYFTLLGGMVIVVGIAVDVYALAREFEGAVMVNEGGQGASVLALGCCIALGLAISMLQGLRMTAEAIRSQFAITWQWSTVGLPPSHVTATNRTQSEACDILAISDLHLVAPGSQGTLEPGAIAVMVERAFILSSVATSRARLVIVCGDATDSGDVQEWQEVEHLCSAIVAAGASIIMAPGNHDCHFGLLARTAWLAMLVRLFQPWEPNPSSSLHEGNVIARIRAIATVPESKESAGKPHFPLVYELRDPKLTVFVFDSNRRPSGSPLTNAIGLLGSDQIARAREALNRLKDRANIIFVMHHHVMPPPMAWVTPPSPFLSCVDSRDLLRLAEENGIRAILHGHTHTPYLYNHEIVGASRRTVRIISVGSSAFPADGPFKETLGAPSAFGLRVTDDDVLAIRTFVDAAPTSIPGPRSLA